MSMCASGILMSALTLGLILADIYNDKTNYITEHAILGGIVSILFFTMCNYGYEIINWIILASIPLFIFLKWVFSSKTEDTCNECSEPKRRWDTNEYPSPQNECSEDNECNKKEYKTPRTCPAKGGLTMGDKCGVSRFI
jgi:hypothetical protein|uniref:Uncharacterized protein n=1 Tax=viral metagenome TaxID=1070528 RepID=A0A6C0DKS0_9ZZZZ